jgi:putative salt-induced outer membrane protein YdiY
VAGAALTRGNTESSTANFGAEATRRTDNDRLYLGAGYYFANQRDNNTGENSTSADNWFLKGKYDYFFTKKFFGYANMKYEKDRIAYLDMRLTPGAGAGYQWIENARFNFFTEAGLTYVHEKYTDPDEIRNYAAARGAYHFNFVINDHLKGFHNLEVIPNIEDVQAVLVYTDVGLRAAMTERLFLEGKAQLAYNSQPADNREKKDMRYTLGIGWTF